MMISGNSHTGNNNIKIGKRFKVYYDNKPHTAADAQKRVCLELKSTGQIIRLNEAEAFDLMSELARAMKWGYDRRFH